MPTRIKDFITRQQNIRAWVVIFILAIASALIRYSALPDISLSWHFYTFIVFALALYFVWGLFKWIDKLLNKWLPYRKGIAKRIAVQIGLGILIITLLRNFWMKSLEYNVPDDMPMRVHEMFYDRIFQHILFMIDILISVTFNGNFIATHFFEEWRKSIIKLERTEKERAMVHFDNLKNQLNPHFLFNSLSSLNSLIFENQQLASDFLQQLSKVYRYVLQNRDNETVKLKTEIDFISHYISLLQTRFKSYFTIEIDVSEDASDLKIVPVTIQILVENAVKHNVISEEQPLQIKLYDADGYLVLENSLQLKKQVEHSNKVGLDNMRKLYSYLDERPVLIEQTSNLFRVKIPLLP